MTSTMAAADGLLDIVHTESSLGWGGQEIRILTEAAALAARGHRVELLCPPEARIFQEAARFGVRVTACPIGKKNLRGLWHLRRALAQRKIDVLNTHSSTDSWLSALASLTFPNPPFIVRTRHISAPLTRNPATRWLYTRATRHIVTTGERLRLQLQEEIGVEATKATSVPTGIDTQRFAPGDRRAARRRTGLPTTKLIIGIVATLRSWKGHRFLVDALAKMARDDVHLAIIGDGPQWQAINEQVARLGLAARVTLAGNQSDVVPWLQSSDIFVLPSYANEGVPQAILQAMSCGLPVISTPVGSIGEILTPGENGLMVKEKDVDSLAESLVRLADDAVLRDRLGSIGRQTALKEFSIERMADAMEKLFISVVTRDRID